MEMVQNGCFDMTSTQSMNYVPVSAGIVSNVYAEGLNDENVKQERFVDDSSSKDVNVVGQQVNIVSLDVNTGSLELNVVGPLVSTASSNEEDGNCNKSVLAYASFMGFSGISNGFVKSAFIWKHEEDVYVTQPTGIVKISDNSHIKFLRWSSTSTEEGLFISLNKYVAEILKKFNYSDVKSASTPVDLEKPLVKDGDVDDVDVHLYRSMIGSLMYLIASRPDIIYLKGKPTLGLWYSRDSPFELVAYTDSDYAGATQDRKSTTRDYLFTKGFDAGRFQYLVSITAAGLLTTVRHNLVLPVQVNAAEDDFINTSIQETSIRSDLHLKDADGTYCLPTATIFEELARIRRKQKKNTKVPHPSNSTADVPNEEHVPTHSNDPLLSGEDRMKLTELMDMCTKLSERILDLEHTKTSQAQEIINLKLRVKKLENKRVQNSQLQEIV
ncbi:uncharacterized mitochondrial protein-like protein [Tanacetum coccineum]